MLVAVELTVMVFEAGVVLAQPAVVYPTVTVLEPPVNQVMLAVAEVAFPPDTSV